MTVSRRLRFEILRRDRHTCRYCGAAAPDVSLTVDHVIPVTLGGGDEPQNLVTACAACNAGKSSIAPDAELVDDVDATAMLFARALEHASTLRRADRAALNEFIDGFETLWAEYGNLPRPNDWAVSVERFYAAGLDLATMRDFAYASVVSRAALSAVWRYFCGCCWRELTERQELARRLIEDGTI